MGEMSKWIFRAKPRTQPHTCILA